MRIMLWTEAFWPGIGGSEAAATTLIDALRPRGCEFLVVTRRDEQTPETHTDYHGTRVVRLPLSRDLLGNTADIAPQIIMMRQQVAKLKRTFQPDLVHVSLPGPSAMLHKWTTPSVYDCPTLVSLHVALTEEELSAPAWSVRTTLDADHVTTCSHDLHDKTVQALPSLADKTSVQYNGLPLPDLAPAALPMHPPRLFCAGRLTEPKGFAYAIRAMPRLRQRFPDLRLTIAGDGEQRDALEALARELNVAEAVEMPGWVDPGDIPAWINASTAVLVPSRWETFGLVALQGAQLARPVIASNVDGLPEVVSDGVTGRLHTPCDADALADAVIDVLGNAPRAAQMGAAGRQRAASTFGVAPYADAFEKLYEQLTRPTAIMEGAQP